MKRSINLIAAVIPHKVTRAFIYRTRALAGAPYLTLAGFASMGIAAAIITAAGGCETQHTRDAAINTYVRGMMAYESGDRATAEIDLQKAIEQHGDLTMAHAALGDLYQDKKDYADAATQYKVVTQLDPYAAVNHYNLGLMYQMLDRLQDAVASYLRALQLEPGDFLSNLNLAATYATLNKPMDALPYALKATELNPQSPGAFFNLGIVQDALGNTNAAEVAYRRASELGDPVDAAMRLADDLIREQKYGDAHSVLQVLVKDHDSARARKRLGDTCFLQKKFEDAVDQYAQALKLDPGYYPAMNEAGWALVTEYSAGLGLDENKRQTAVDIWRRSLKVNPDQPKIRDLIKRYSEKFAE